MNMKKSKAVATMLRLRRKLHQRIKKSARRNGRSLNAEIISLIETGFRREGYRKLIKESVEAMGYTLMNIIRGAKRGPLVRNIDAENQREAGNQR